MTGGLHEARTLSVSIACHPDAVYAYVHDLRNLPRWSFFTSADEQDDGSWIVGTPAGRRVLRIVGPNEFGVLDHLVQLPSGEMRIPVRVVPNGDGAEVLFTVFRAPGMSDEDFTTDASQVEVDLARLKAILEAGPGTRP